MLSNYKILTITHKNARLDDLRHFVIQQDEDILVKQKLDEIKASLGIKELLYLSTCNRIMYLLYTEQTCNPEFVARFFNSINPQLPELIGEQIADMLQVFEGLDAIEHLYQVAASVDSMVVGEREILRQVKEAYQQSQSWELTGDNIRLAMRATVESAKEVYANTRIGEKPVSVVSLAIQKLIQSRLPKDARILLIGAGQTNSLVAKFLLKHQYSHITVFNRSIERAQVLAEKVNGRAFALEVLAEYQEGFDAVIICTGATQAILKSEGYTQLLAGEKDQKVLIDLAIPNNIDRKVVEQFPVNYIEIEDLRALANENLAFREREVTKVKDLLKEQIHHFEHTYRQRQVERAMQQIPAEIKAIKSHALKKVFKKELEGLDEETRNLMERMMSYMEKQCISVPMKAALQVIEKRPKN